MMTATTRHAASATVVRQSQSIEQQVQAVSLMRKAELARIRSRAKRAGAPHLQCCRLVPLHSLLRAGVRRSLCARSWIALGLHAAKQRAGRL